MLIPLTHPLGKGPSDFGKVLVVVTRVKLKAHDLTVNLPHSHDSFVMEFSGDTTERARPGRVQWTLGPISNARSRARGMATPIAARITWSAV
jgi:hypothetical protein